MLVSSDTTQTLFRAAAYATLKQRAKHCSVDWISCGGSSVRHNTSWWAHQVYLALLHCDRFSCWISFGRKLCGSLQLLKKLLVWRLNLIFEFECSSHRFYHSASIELLRPQLVIIFLAKVVVVWIIHKFLVIETLSQTQIMVLKDISQHIALSVVILLSRKYIMHLLVPGLCKKHRNKIFTVILLRNQLTNCCVFYLWDAAEWEEKNML